MIVIAAETVEALAQVHVANIRHQGQAQRAIQKAEAIRVRQSIVIKK